MAQDAALGSLVDELLTCIATFLPDASSLLAFERVSSRFASVAHEAAWRGLCEKRWEDKPRYRLTAKREAELSTHMRTLSWRRRYATFEVDGRRSSITDEELCSLGWYFNYTPNPNPNPNPNPSPNANQVLRGAAVVGLTTTGAAKYQSLVRQLGARVPSLSPLH